MNFQNSIKYLQDVYKTPGHNQGTHIAFHEYVSNSGDVWVIEETRTGSPWVHPREWTEAPSGRRQPPVVSVFSATCVIENAGRGQSLNGLDYIHETIELTDSAYWKKQGATTYGSYPCAPSLDETHARIEAIDVARYSAWVGPFNASEADRLSKISDPYEIQTWEWDAQRGCEVETISTVPEMLHSDPYGGAE